MSDNDRSTLTHHAMLVAWGQFAQSIGLVRRFEAVPVHQKTVDHSPNRKVLEFLAAILGGLPHLQDISRSAHPLDRDPAVARAWGQEGWADYSGVSRTLSALTMVEAQQFVQVLDDLSAPFVDQEVLLAMRDQGAVVYDADLTGLPVSNGSSSYPNVAYGYMSDALQLGYQAALVSLHSPTYGRLWLSTALHPGDTVPCTQAEALVRAAEAKTGVRPLRRTDLLRQRLAKGCRVAEERVQKAQRALIEAEEGERQAEQGARLWQEQVTQWEAAYQQRQRRERPHSRLAQARHKQEVYRCRQARRQQEVAKARQRLQREKSRLAQQQEVYAALQQRLQHFEEENASNPSPVRAILRLDAGFGTPENVALLIEMGYEVYTKPHGHWLEGLRQRLAKRASCWERVGGNAELVAWKAMAISSFPYPLDVALERFHTGTSQRLSLLLHYGEEPVTSDLLGWFRCYNGRQTIEAGIKEGKGVFAMHHLKVRSEAALYLQEHFATFAANFVRWAARWLCTECCQRLEEWPERGLPGVKRQVQVLAHTSAYVEWQEQGCLLRFSDHSLWAGRSLQTIRQHAYQMALPLFKSCYFSSG